MASLEQADIIELPAPLALRESLQEEFGHQESKPSP